MGDAWCWLGGHGVQGAHGLLAGYQGQGAGSAALIPHIFGAGMLSMHAGPGW